MKARLLFLLCFISCNTQVSVEPATLRVSMGAEPDTLNPITASDAYASRINSYLYDSLIERNKDTLEFEPKLAKKWKISPDGLKFTFYLREDVKWHDGQPFTADDVVYSFERILDPKTEAHGLRSYFAGAGITKIKKLDDHTIQFISGKPYFMALSVCGSLPLVPKHIFDDGTDFKKHPASRQPIGLGAYVFKEWKTGKRIVLERNENYWDQKPEIKKIKYKFITDAAIALQYLKKGEIDLASLRPIQWMRQTSSSKFDQSFDKKKYLLPGYSYIGWNFKSPFFKDKRVRRAMTHLVDREKLLQKIKFGLGQVVASPFFVDSAQYNTNIKPLNYNPKKAMELLEQAGWRDSDQDGYLDFDGKKFEFKFLYPAESKFSERMATILKEDLKKLGIEMNIERMEWAAFLDRLYKREFDATSLGWSTSFEGDPYQIWHSSQAELAKGSNIISFKNKRVDELIEAARVEYDRGKRNQLYWEFQQIIHDQQPYTFLFSGYSLVVVSKRFKNVKVHKAGLDLTEWQIN